jgi:hypothetical protein
MEVVKNVRIEKGEVVINGAGDFSLAAKTFNLFAKGIYKHYEIDYAKFYKMSALCKLGFLASEILLRDTDLSGTDKDQAALFIANSSSSLHTDSIYQETIEQTPSPAVFVYTLPNIMIGEICIRNGFKGEGVFFVQENFDKTFIFECAGNHLKKSQSAISLAGWVDIDMDGDYLADLYLLK